MRHFFHARRVAAVGLFALALLSANLAPGATTPEQAAEALLQASEADKLKQLEELGRRRGKTAELVRILVPAIEAGKDDVHGSTIRMVQMLGAVNEEAATRELLALLSAKDFRLVMPAIDALGERKAPAHLTALAECAKREEFAALYGFRDCVFSAIAKIADKRSVDFVVEKLPYIDGQLRFDAIVYLSQISGENMGSDATAWADWWRSERDDFQFGHTNHALSVAEILTFYQVLDERENVSTGATTDDLAAEAVQIKKEVAVAAAPAAPRGAPASTPKKVVSRRVAARLAARDGDRNRVLEGEFLANFQPNAAAFANAKLRKLELIGAKKPMPRFFAVPIVSKNFIFVIDVSGSMSETLDNDTKITKAKSQLIKAVQDLPGNTSFNAISFSDRFQDWQPHLVQATREVKMSAAQAISGLSSNGNTNVYDTMHHALGMHDNLEAVILLSDGEPNTGTIPHPQQILAALTQENFLRRVRIHTIGIDPPPSGEDFLKALAAANRGTYTRVNKP